MIPICRCFALRFTQAGSFSGPPKVLAVNLAVFTAVQGGLTLAIKHARGGVEDIYGSMGGMFGAGMSLSLCTNLSGTAPTGPGKAAQAVQPGTRLESTKAPPGFKF